MSEQTERRRTDAASRLIKATPQVIYAALVDPDAVATWRAPSGMTGQVHTFDPRPGGTYRMSLRYDTADHEVAGKSSADEDVVEGRFVELVPGQLVVEVVEFESDDPAFAGEMTIVTSLTPNPDGTTVTIECRDVPPGIKASDHLEGLTSTLANLAAFTE